MLFSVLAVTGSVLHAQTTQAQQQTDVTNLETDFKQYNLISLTNASLTSYGDTEGGIAVNGALTLDAGQIASQNSGIAGNPTLYATGALTLEQAVQTLNPRFAGSSLASELALSRDGRFLFAGNRLRNTITTVGIGPGGQMKVLSEAWTQGDHPRSFTLDPTGRFLICCNQRSDDLTTFRINPETGALTFTGRFDAVGSPAVLAFWRAG